MGRRLLDILGDLAYAEGAYRYLEAEFVIDQVVACDLPGCDLDQPELRELGRTLLPIVAQTIVEGGKPGNRYEITIRPAAEEDEDG